MEWGLFLPLGIALMLGLLVGMQREWTVSGVAGIRTFPLLTLLGTVCAILAERYGGWILAAGILAVITVFAVGNLAQISQGKSDSGATSEVAGLVIFGVGAMLMLGYTAECLAIAGTVAVLLHYKKPLHAWVHQIGERDIKAVMQFVLITLVILPVLPNKTYGPYEFVNPFKTWLMVVLIVGISMAAYLIFHLLGTRVGILLGGLLGGLVSSTATTVSYARQSKNNNQAALLAAAVILIASTVTNARILLEIGVVAPSLLSYAVGPFLVLMIGMSLLASLVFFASKQDVPMQAPDENPAQLKAALVFAGIYSLISLAVTATKEHFGEKALYGVSIISGLADMDAITLSTSNLFADGHISGEVAWQLIMLATLSNLVFKGGCVFVLGSRKLFYYVLLMFGLTLLLGVLLLTLWPFDPIYINFPAMQQVSYLNFHTGT